MGSMHSLIIPSLVMYRAYSVETQAVLTTSPFVLLALLGVYGMILSALACLNFVVFMCGEA